METPETPYDQDAAVNQQAAAVPTDAPENVATPTETVAPQNVAPAGSTPVVENSPAVEIASPTSGLSNEEVAKEVVAGHWGRGQVRKERLADAGYDPEAVDEE